MLYYTMLYYTILYYTNSKTLLQSPASGRERSPREFNNNDIIISSSSSRGSSSSKDFGLAPRQVRGERERERSV